jgi:transcriptional regulator with XRE-family HTH domain
MPKLRPGTDEVVVIPAPPGPDAEDAEVKAWIDRVQGAGVGLEGEELEAWADRVRGKAHEPRQAAKSGYLLNKEFKISKDDMQKIMQLFLTISAKKDTPAFDAFKKNITLKDLDVALFQQVMQDRDSSVNEAFRRRLVKRGDTSLIRDTEEASNYFKQFADQRQPVSMIAAAWGDLCKSVRQKKDWNQRQIAAVLGVRQATVSRWEVGLSAPDAASRSKLIALAREVGVDHDLPAEEAKIEFLQISLSIKNRGEVAPFDQQSEKSSIPFVPISTRGEGTRAIIVKTNDLLPRYERGDVLVVGAAFDPAEMVLRECLVTRADGSYAFGLIRKLANHAFAVGEDINDAFTVGEDLNGPPIVNAFPVLTVIREVALRI